MTTFKNSIIATFTFIFSAILSLVLFVATFTVRVEYVAENINDTVFVFALGFLIPILFLLGIFFLLKSFLKKEKLRLLPSIIGVLSFLAIVGFYLLTSARYFLELLELKFCTP